jgi:soluble lytic murein transglycosylase-like protein
MSDSFAPPARAAALACGMPPLKLVPDVSVQRRRALIHVLLRSAIVPVGLAVVAVGLITTRVGDAQAPRIEQAQVAAPPRFDFDDRSQQPVAELATTDLERDFTFDLDRLLERASHSVQSNLRSEAEPADRFRAGLPHLLQFGPMRVRRDLVEVIILAARKTDMDPALLMSIADKESSFAPTVKASTSSATGLFQFIEATWMRVVRDFGARHGMAQEAALIADAELRGSMASATRQGILNLRNDPYLSALMAAEMLKADSARIAARIGRDLSEGETYLAHFLGPSDAEKFMSKVVAEPRYAAPKLLPKPARANRSIFYEKSRRKPQSLTVADVHRKFENMMGLRFERYRDVEKVAGLTAYSDPRAD